jgi:ABC-type multidrug transport system fused ATPase/permease subunit
MTGEQRKQRPKLDVVWREARELIWTYRRRLLLGLGLLVISRLAGMVLPASTKFLIDEVIGNGRKELLTWIALAVGGATILQSATSFSLAILLGVAAQRAINDFRLRVQQHVALLPVRFFEEHKTGELISRIMTDAEGIRNLVGTGFVQMIGGMMTAVVAFAVLLWLNWRLTLLTLVMLLLFAAIMVFGFNRLRPVFRERSRLNAELTGRLNEALGGIRVVKAYTAERREARVFAHGAHQLLRKVAQTMVGVSAITSVSGLLFGLASLAVGILGAREVLAERMTIGDILMFVVFTGLMVTPLVQMANIGTQITEAFAGLDRIREILSQSTENQDPRRHRRLDRVRGEVVFEDVTFEYKPCVPVLDKVSLHAPSGSTTALVGPSGSGKSTLIALVMAFRTPLSGRVLVDGVDLAEVRLRDYRSQLAVVLQDDFLFDGTLAENIAYSRPASSRAEIERVGRLARCDEFVAGFADGYDTVIGERGVKLSGGQRQRVAIARAMLANPRILILDEATSSLDSDNEARIQEGLRELKKGRTTFVIAHRLSTIRNADQILVLKEGRVVEHGTHDELLAAGGVYRGLHDQQFNLEADRFLNPGEGDEVEEDDDEGQTAAADGADGSSLLPFGRGGRD